MSGLATLASHPQHLRALERANTIRLARAELKRKVARGERSVAEVIMECPEAAARMSIAELLCSQHRWGVTRSRRFLARIPIPERKHIGTLTERQQLAIVERLRDEAPATANRELVTA